MLDNFLDKVGKPNVERIEGLTPAIAIDQKQLQKSKFNCWNYY